METLTATGDFQGGLAPTLAVSRGRGNTNEAEVHLLLRETDEASSRTVMAWFNRDDLLAAIGAAA